MSKNCVFVRFTRDLYRDQEAMRESDRLMSLDELLESEFSVMGDRLKVHGLTDGIISEYNLIATVSIPTVREPDVKLDPIREVFKVHSDIRDVFNDGLTEGSFEITQAIIDGKVYGYDWIKAIGLRNYVEMTFERDIEADREVLPYLHKSSAPAPAQAFYDLLESEFSDLPGKLIVKNDREGENGTYYMSAVYFPFNVEKRDALEILTNTRDHFQKCYDDGASGFFQIDAVVMDGVSHSAENLLKLEETASPSL